MEFVRKPRTNYARRITQPFQTRTQPCGSRLRACQKAFFDKLNRRCSKNIADIFYPISAKASREAARFEIVGEAGTAQKQAFHVRAPLRAWCPFRKSEDHAISSQRVDVGIDPYDARDIGNVPTSIRPIFNGRTRSDPYLRAVRCGNPILRPPEGRSLTAGVTTTRKTERFVFLRVSAISASSASFLHTFFWQDRNGTKQQTSEALAVWRGRAAQ